MKRSPLSITLGALLLGTLQSVAFAQSGGATSDQTGVTTTEAATGATAADPSGESANESEPAAKESPPPAHVPPTGRATVAASDAATDDSDDGVGAQRVPRSGYPTYKTRGLYGGSLWLTFHGLQWPYMPRKTGEPALMLGLSGSGWVDTAYVSVKAGTPNEQDAKYMRQQGRFVFRATPTYRSGDWFAQGQVEVVANNDQSQNRSVAYPDTDDLWLRAGKWNTFDVQAGRFEAWEVYHLGMGLDLNTFERRGARIEGSSYIPPDFYGATHMYGRPSGGGNAAGHIYFTDWLRLELLTRIGNDGGLNTIGERPALIFDVGYLKIKGALEYLEGRPTSAGIQSRLRQQGGAGAVQVTLEPHVEFGGNVAYGTQDTWDSTGSLNEPATWSVYSYGGFVNVHLVDALLAGGGYNYTHIANAHPDPNSGKVGESAQTQIYGALQYGLWRQLFIKAVVGYADADFINIAFDNTPSFHRKMLSGRLRASFYF